MALRHILCQSEEIPSLKKKKGSFSTKRRHRQATDSRAAHAASLPCPEAGSVTTVCWAMRVALAL